MSPIPSFSDCLRVLRLAGFRVVERDHRGTLARRGIRMVFVPQLDELTAASFELILDAAGMTEHTFAVLLDAAEEHAPPSSRRAVARERDGEAPVRG